MNADAAEEEENKRLTNDEKQSRAENYKENIKLFAERLKEEK